MRVFRPNGIEYAQSVSTKCACFSDAASMTAVRPCASLSPASAGPQGIFATRATSGAALSTAASLSQMAPGVSPRQCGAGGYCRIHISARPFFSPRARAVAFHTRAATTT